MLGSLKEVELRTLLDGLALPAVTGATLVDRHTLMADLARCRKRGYYVTRGKNVPDVRAVAASLALNAETLAVAIAGPRHRMERSLTDCAHLLVATCSMLGQQSGG